MPRLNEEANCFEFEGIMSDYYPDPIPQSLWRDRDSKAKQTWTRSQYCYATVNPMFQATLGSRNLRVNTKFFVDGITLSLC
jgi:hypothetical protein